MSEIIKVDGRQFVLLNNSLVEVPPEGNTSASKMPEGNTSASKMPERNNTASKKRGHEDVLEEDGVDDEDEADSEAVKKNKNSRTKWLPSEVEKLIQIINERNIVAKMDGKCGRLSNAAIFKHVSQVLNACELGQHKTPQQCLLKCRKLRETYNLSVKKIFRSGQDSEKCLYFEELSEAFGSRPVAKASDYGYDSSEIQLEELEDDPGQQAFSSKTPDGSSPKTDNRSADCDKSPSKSPSKGSKNNGKSPEKHTYKSPKRSPGKSPQKSKLGACPRRYRSGSGKATTTQRLLKQVLEKEEEEAAEFRKFTAEQMKAQQEQNNKLLAGLTNAITTGIASFGQMLAAQNASPASGAFYGPTNVPPPNFVPAPTNVLQTQRPAPARQFFFQQSSAVPRPALNTQQSIPASQVLIPKVVVPNSGVTITPKYVLYLNSKNLPK